TRATGSSPLPAIPHQPDRRIGPARTKAAAIIAPAEKPGTAEIVPVAIVPVLRRIVRRAGDGALRTIDRNMLVRRLVIAGQEAIAMPVRDVPLMGGRGERDGCQQRQQNCAREGQDARHRINIDGQPSKFKSGDASRPPLAMTSVTSRVAAVTISSQAEAAL